MERFQLTAHLQTPIIIGGGYLTLDALLGSILFEQLQDVEEAHAQIPLVCADGWYIGWGLYRPLSVLIMVFGILHGSADHKIIIACFKHAVNLIGFECFI